MKPLAPHRLIVALLMLLLSAVTAFSQNIAGEWTGRLWQVASGAEFIYAMKLEQNGDTAVGRAFGRPAGGGGLGEWEISITVDSDSIFYRDLSVTGSPSPGSSYCLKEGRLNYDSRSDRIYGTIEGYVIRYGFRSQCPSISFDLKKTEASKGERPSPKRNKDSWAGNGTGVVIDSKGIIATNYHVVEEATDIEADFGIGDHKRSYRCEVLLTDKKNDLAILKISDTRFSGFGPLPYAFKVSVARVGESVFALGYPKALSMLGTEIKFTRGDISALSGAEGDPTTYTLSLSIQPGNSGGPLFDLNGNLIGITNAKIVSPDVDNISYAIKSVYLKSFIDLSPYKINLPNGSGLQGKPVVDQIEVLSDYIGLIKIR
jgi:S1-C subfamily serine protease